MTSHNEPVEQLNISTILCKAFHPVHKAIVRGEKSEIWLKGGRGSTKSSFTAIEIILGIIEDPDANAICLRKVGDTIRTSLLPTFLWAIDVLGVHTHFRHTVAPAEIIYIPTGQKIIMKGLDDPMKLKSVKARRGYFKYLWFEEASEYDGMEEIRSVEQSVLRGGETFVEFITYNPPNDPAAWVNKECLEEYPDRLVHHSTYLDVDPAWLGAKFLEKAERLRQTDYLKYEHEYLGKAVGRAEQIVFYGKWEEKRFDTPSLKHIYQSRFFYGADWGFANDPTALTRSFIIKKDDKMYLFIDYEAGGVGVEFEQLPALFERIPESRKWKIKADSARPETISYMSRQGFNIEAAKKWKGSVEDGVEYIKGFTKIYVHPRCVNTIEELKTYCYKVDRNTQEILPVIVDANNHYIDSIRYGLDEYIQMKGSILDVL
jgi:phage terminase large subunit